MHTEDQAKKLWCPMVRMGDSDDSSPSNSVCCVVKGLNRNPEWSRCIASDCAMWRWDREYNTKLCEMDQEKLVSMTKGYCGLAGGSW